MLVQRGHGVDHNDCLLGRPRPGRQQTFWLLLRHERERTDRPAGDCRDGRDPRASNRQLERCCFAASEQHYLPPRRSHHDAAPARHAEARALRAPSGSCVSRPSRQRHGGRRALLFSPGAAVSATGMPMPGNAPRRGRRDVCELYGVSDAEGSPNAGCSGVSRGSGLCGSVLGGGSSDFVRGAPGRGRERPVRLVLRWRSERGAPDGLRSFVPGRSRLRVARDFHLDRWCRLLGGITRRWRAAGRARAPRPRSRGRTRADGR